MGKFPKEKPPKEYNQEIFTRAFEQMYEDLGGVDQLAEKVLKLQAQQRQTSESVGNVQNTLKQNQISDASPLPIPENLKIYKVPLIPLIVMWCDPVEIIKYPYVGGIQFFASPESNFTPLEASGLVTYEGTCTLSSGGAILADTSDVTVSGVPALGAKYTGIPFWEDMKLQTDAVNITNVTDDSSGTVTAWSRETPWNITCPLSGGTNNVWASGDEYRFSIQRNKNLIGQGPLPFAVQLFPFLQVLNSKWDAYSVYGKARFYGKGLPKHRRYGQLACASNTSFADQELPYPTNVTAEPYTESNQIIVTWTKGHENGDAFAGYKVYRTLADVAPTDDTDLIASNVVVETYTDDGYDANGPDPGITYYYWVRVVDTGGFQSDFGTSDDAELVVPAAPTFLSGEEEETTGSVQLKNWVVSWKAVGGAVGYNVKYKITGEGYSPVTYVAHTDAFGQDGGDDIQRFTFMALETGRNYTFAIQSVNNLTVTGLQSAFTEQAYDIENSDKPLPPT